MGIVGGDVYWSREAHEDVIHVDATSNRIGARDWFIVVGASQIPGIRKEARVSDVKVIVMETCDERERERLVRFMQDAFGWVEGKDYTVSTSSSQASEGDELHTCTDCGSPFTFTVGEQRYYGKNNLQPPKRCPECRRQRKLSRERPETHGRRPRSSFSHESSR